MTWSAKECKAPCALTSSETKFTRAPKLKGNNYEDRAYMAWIYGIDEQCQVDSPWKVTNSKGITWGDIMTGIMLVKGSKSDWWYELLAVTAKIKGSELQIDPGLNFGS